MRTVVSRKPLGISCHAFYVLLGLFLSFYAACKDATPQLGGEILGVVAMQPNKSQSNEANKTGAIYLPDIKVSLTDSTGAAVGSAVTTSLDGRFEFPHVPAGKYDVCAEADGFAKNCTTITISSSAASVYPPLLITPTGREFVYGRVTSLDGQPGFMNDPVFGLAWETQVTLSNGTGILDTRRANIRGEYVLPKAALGPGTINASSQGGSGSKPVTIVAGGKREDFSLNNHRPAANSMVGYDGGVPAKIVAGGTTVKMRIEATDSDGDPLHYAWEASGNTGGFVNADAADIDWTLPMEPGLYTMYAIVHDQKGAHSRIKTDIKVGEKRVLISGFARELDGKAVKDAEVRIYSNGRGDTTTTNALGYFSRYVDLSSRIVVNLDKEGYSLTSTVVYGELVNGIYTMFPATVQSGLDPTNPIDLTEDLKNSRDREFRQPATIKIPAGALVGKDKKQYNGPVVSTMRTYAVMNGDDAIPGDYAAVRGTSQNSLDTYGALDITPRGSAGEKLDLAPGMLADVSIPVDNRLKSPPNMIALWSYDETRGMWVSEGSASLNGPKTHYEAKVKHFSVYNADVEFTDASCMQLLHNPIAGVVPPFDVKVISPTSSGAVKVLNITNLVDFPSVVVRLPHDSVITVETYKLGALIHTQTVFMATNNPGPAQTNPPFPYDMCKNRCYIPGATYPVDEATTFLFRVNNDEVAANNYYAAIGASGLNFNDWKASVGFDCEADTSAIYYNAGDLGFWRQMHYKRINRSGCSVPETGHYAYYVTNFRSDVDAQSNTNAIATVGMEFSPLAAGGSAVTKFFVWNGAGAQVNKADLDGNGEKFIPGLCVVCHGGTTSGIASGNLQSKFIPFDIYTFEYSGLAGLDSAAQQQNFYRMNRGTYLIADSLGRPASLGPQQVQAIKDYVREMYDNFTPNPTFRPDSTYLPSNGSYAGLASLYHDVVAPGCRSCHIQRTSQALHFDLKSEFDACYPVVCAQYMPNAKLTYQKFWMGHHDSPCILKNVYGASFTCPPISCP